MPRKGKQANKTVVKVIQQKPQAQKTRKNRRRTQPPKTKPTVIGRGLRALGGAAGGFIGQAKLGRALGAGISQIFGQGDYSLNEPKMNTLMPRSGVPAFSPLTSGFRIQHREYIRDISSSVDFASVTYNINPGLSDLFPWLSQVAPNFEEYKIHGMIVYLNTLSGVAVASTNTALGLWGAVTQYDPTEPSFTTKQEAENYVGCQTSVPSCSLIHGIECKPNVNILNKFFVRTGSVPNDEDLKFYDLGKLQIFTQGSQNVNIIGEMWVSYDIEFTKPRLATGGNTAAFGDHYFISNSTQTSAFGSSAAPLSGSNLGTTAAGNVITVPSTAPAGIYFLSINVDILPSALAMTSGVATFGGSLTGSAVLQNGTSYRDQAPSGSSVVSAFQLLFTFRKTQGSGTITLSNLPAYGGGSSTLEAILTRLPPDITLQKGKLTFSESEMTCIRKMIARYSNAVGDPFEEEKIATDEMSFDQRQHLEFISPIKDHSIVD
jgi:hypothetical protein